VTRNVLHLIGSNCVGGPEKQILHHAVDMQGSDYNIEVGSFHDGIERPEIVTAAEQRGLRTVCLSGGLRLSLPLELAGILAARPGYLLCTHGFKANVVGYLAAKRTNTPHVAFLRGWTAENLRVAFYEVLERRALGRAPWVVCVSRQQAEQVGKLRKGRTTPFVVQNAMLPPYERKAQTVVTRETLGIPSDTFVFGSVGRLSIEKGHRFMVTAFLNLCRMAPDAPLYLVLVGDGHEQESLEKQSAELGIRDKVMFAGYQGNCTEWMRLMDCMVQPSLTEGTPNSVLEAMCLDLPVVATAVGGVPDLIVDGENGLLVAPGDIDALAQAMQRILSPDLRSKLVVGGEAITREYSSERQREKLIEVYQKAFEGHVYTAQLNGSLARGR
jgi:glycosyltransferase involved in cell wall biosynthesis